MPPATAPVHPNPACVLETAPTRRWRCSIGSAVDWIPTTDGFRLVIQGVKVRNNGVPDPGGKDDPRNAFGYTTVKCTTCAGVPGCTTILDVSFWWGTNLAWTDYLPSAIIGPDVFLYAMDDTYRLNSTHRSHYCSPDPGLPNNGRDACLANPPVARHVKFESMTPTSGRAIVYGSNGWSVVTKIPRPATDTNTANEYVQVRRTLTQAVTAGGTIYPVGTGPLEIDRCIVGAASGDWTCAFVTSTP